MGDEKGFNIFKTLATIERRWIYLIVLIFTLYPVLRPVGMPVAIDPWTRDYYEIVDPLGPDDVVMMNFGSAASGYMELKSGQIATLKMMIERGVKIAMTWNWPEMGTIALGVMGDPENNVPGILTNFMERHDYKHWEDYIILGFVIPNEPAVVAAARDFKGFINRDWRGRSIEGTFLDKIHDAGDWDLISEFTCGGVTVFLIRHFAMDYGTPMISNSIGVSIPGHSIYLEPGYLKALLKSTRGGAELEILSGHPGSGAIAMDAFSLVHYMLIAFIIIGNIGYFGWERKTRARARGS